MFQSPFDGNQEEPIIISNDVDVIFVSDLFAEDHLGGAEITTESLLSTSPFSVLRVHSKNVTSDLITQGSAKYWIFGNFSGLNFQLIPEIVGNLEYSIIEYDYKFCKYRSPEKHFFAENTPCNCRDELVGKMTSAFMYGASSLWWMSREQMRIYHTTFPFLADKDNHVLSSIFDSEFFDTIDALKEKHPQDKKSGDLIIGSDSWIKGVEDSEAWCKENSEKFETVTGLSHFETLEKMARSERLVFLPRGGDTCPRTVIEAKLLGCKLVINNNVQHALEPWFNTDDLDAIQVYLLGRHEAFWSEIDKTINYEPTVSGYTQAYNVMESNYPWRESISSLLGFCDEVVVVDGGSDDGTWEELEDWASKEEKLVVKQCKRDWDDKRFALFNGQQKAVARAYCTKEWCWQVDIDEVVHEEDYPKVKNLIKMMPKGTDLVALPVIEYWGGPDKVRVDINPWKWRLSRNNPHITHGLPGSHRRFDENGTMYSAGSDGDDYIRSDSLENIPCATFYTEEIDNQRAMAITEGLDSESLAQFQSTMELVVDKLPGVYHYSWYDMRRKVRTYRDFWSKHWASLYNRPVEDIPENNMFFDKKWSEVSDEEIDKIADRLSEEMGGWIFHNRVDFNKKTPWIKLERSHPEIMNNWLKKHTRG